MLRKYVGTKFKLNKPENNIGIEAEFIKIHENQIKQSFSEIKANT
jgi:hypothetical protein